MREYPPGLGIPHEQVCDQTLYLLVGMLVIGLVCKLLVRPLADTWFMSPAGLAEEKRLTHDRAVVADAGPGTQTSHRSSNALVVPAWGAVGIRLASGV